MLARGTDNAPDDNPPDDSAPPDGTADDGTADDGARAPRPGRCGLRPGRGAWRTISLAPRGS
ncbi:hypothetical protein ACIPLC_19615 [Kitasatospora sp. NPDC086801]|uniref:hypothetical protein n=1 Tax=Kitasatospora sp. NPDC086801 TaxID=3364066 RepID=UPI003801ED28